ncbi:MAG TPA: ABC transporter substrate binding protein [Candidatus Binatia bacterium]|nr:ABC transporter substrate binding protein [Candidatus Binatia bacterium]
MDGCRAANGLAVVVDVPRAFTTAATAFAGEVEEILLVSTVEEAFDLRARYPDYLLIGEVDGLPVDGFGTPATQAAKNATQTIPIVMTGGSDPLGTGLVTSLAHPGGNVTGLTDLYSDLGGKQLELLKEASSKVSRVVVLWDPANPGNTTWLGGMKVAAGALSLTLQPVEVQGPNDLEPAFSAIKRERARALSVLSNAVTTTYRTRIVDFAAKSRLPAMYSDRESVETGGLMSYGPNLSDMWRRAAIYVDKILKGAKPADLPVEQPTKFEFVINLKTAKQIGLTIPPNVLARADKVIK